MSNYFPCIFCYRKAFQHQHPQGIFHEVGNTTKDCFWIAAWWQCTGKSIARIISNILMIRQIYCICKFSLDKPKITLEDIYLMYHIWSFHIVVFLLFISVFSFTVIHEQRLLQQLIYSIVLHDTLSYSKVIEDHEL